EERTHAIEAVLLHWKSLSVPAFRGLNGWRHERFGVYDNSGSLAFAVERSGASLLGSRCYGCHLNGYIRDPASGQIKMWIARRSLKKPTHPGALDNIVGGGLPTGSSPLANIIKECAEEAGIPDHLASKVTPCGTISYITNNWSDPAKSRNGFYQDTEYVYDLELSPDFVPQPEDGEVEQFYLWDLDTVKQHILNGEFVLESAFVVIDFLIRHGYLHAGNDPHFLEIVTGIHRTLISPGP
ncbi:NUDIX hydrolase domain-like protein, partial [Polychytrium aggregatum]|uniref:NUDIX hydrolase domain-like protein n=1 Tax=Polychytrium aggregatum TaxID=110093 RepID=UPI0022FDFDB3